MDPHKIKDYNGGLISIVFSDIPEIALVTVRLGQFQELMKTQVI